MDWKVDFVNAAPLFPIFLKLEGKNCLVVGAGPVGEGKIRGLLESDVYRENIGQRAHDYASREFTSAAASRYLELIETRPVRAGIRAADGGTIQ